LFTTRQKSLDIKKHIHESLTDPLEEINLEKNVRKKAMFFIIFGSGFIPKPLLLDYISKASSLPRRRKIEGIVRPDYNCMRLVPLDRS